MRTIVGSVIGALAMGVLLLAYNGSGRAGAGQTQPYATPARFVSDANPAQAFVPPTGVTSAAAGPVLVKCEPTQQALVRDARGVNGEAVRQIECVGSPASSAVYVDQYGRTIAVPDAQFTNANVVARPVQTVTYEPARVRERVVYRQAPERVVRRTAANGRTWKKSALVIGGSAGTGAGIGAIAGGKKGALIGAAIGGGAATLFEATKHR